MRAGSLKRRKTFGNLSPERGEYQETTSQKIAGLAEQRMTVALELTDDELFRRMREGDEEAFAALYRRRQQGLFRYVLQMSGSEPIAEDVVQEVFMVLMRDTVGFDPSRGSLSSYLYGIARNLTLRRIDRNRVFVALEDENGGGVAAELACDSDPHWDMTRAETVELVRQAVRSLPEHYREAVVLCDLHEMSYQEAADVIGCAVGTVRSRLHRGRSILVDRLRDARPEPAPNRALTRGCFV